MKGIATTYGQRRKAEAAKVLGRCNPIRQGNDEYRCTTCGKVWDTHEPKPDCERD